MSTTQVTAVLYQLQQLDLEIDRLTAEQQTITTSLQGNVPLRKLRLDFENAQKQMQAGLQTQKEAEWALGDLENRLKEQEKRLYNGTVNTARELKALQQEVQHLRAQQSRQEDVLLEVIDTVESLTDAVKQKQAALKRAEEVWEQERGVLEERRKQIEVRQGEIQGKRVQLTSGVKEELLKRYETMRRNKQGRAVSKIEQNSCQWCRVILTPSELQQVRINSELQTCSNCGRILHYDR